MANQEHLDRLKQGVEAWNDWRRHHPEEDQLDLTDANLSGEALAAVNLYDDSFVHALNEGLGPSEVMLGFVDLSRS
jgi:hypothetical protein